MNLEFQEAFLIVPKVFDNEEVVQSWVNTGLDLNLYLSLCDLELYSLSSLYLISVIFKMGLIIPTSQERFKLK